MAIKRFFGPLLRKFSQDSISRLAVRETRLTIAANAKKLAERNARHLFRTGADTDGTSLGKYRPKTIRIKLAKGQPINRVTLRDTGAFHDSILVQAGPTLFTYSANDEKKEDLVFRYGPDILGLDQLTFAEFLRPLLIKAVVDGINKQGR